MEIDAISINRAPVLTLWAAIVAERLGFTHDEALTLGRAVAGLNAYSKGRALWIFKPPPKDVRAKREAKAKGKEVLQVELLHRGGAGGADARGSARAQQGETRRAGERGEVPLEQVQGRVESGVRRDDGIGGLEGPRGAG